MNGSGPGGVKSISPGSTFAPGSGFTGSPDVIPPGHTEHATPVGAPISPPPPQPLDYRATFCCHIILARRWFSAHHSIPFII
ncbi:Uncharacterised protein [Salmonella enterica subsp. enterica serovar Derby]|nr:Uncharacterised protein [Salmonella enterica subsp. enterica serovar Derby]